MESRLTPRNSAPPSLRTLLLELCSTPEYREELVRLLDESQGEPASTVPILQRLVRDRLLDRIAARAAYLIAAGELDPRDLKEVLPRRPLCARPTQDQTADTPPGRIPFLEPGQVLGRSMIESVLLSGPHATLYHATHVGIGCPVVVKVAGSCRGSEQLRSETRILTEIAHPNVVRMWDAGRHLEFPFLAIESMPKGSLRDVVLRGGPLPPNEVIRVACDAVRGLQAARAAGYVHGDVKPGNLLVASSGTVKVADFGTAQRVNAEGLVPVDVVSGSWSFLAPERFGNFWDHRVDIYSLGLTIYFLLTGVHSVTARTPRECLLAHRDLNLEPLHWTVSGVSRAASAVFLRMTARDPANRPSNYDELLAELSRLREAPAGDRDTDSEGNPS
jgi:serine/threonine protein kinase